jgi:hypothetical protein
MRRWRGRSRWGLRRGRQSLHDFAVRPGLDVAGVAKDVVTAGAADIAVIARTAAEHVVARTAVQIVVASEAKEPVPTMNNRLKADFGSRACSSASNSRPSTAAGEACPTPATPVRRSHGRAASVTNAEDRLPSRSRPVVRASSAAPSRRSRPTVARRTSPDASTRRRRRRIGLVPRRSGRRVEPTCATNRKTDEASHSLVRAVV